MRYMYMRNKKDNSVTCVGYSVEGNKITAGFSFCSPKDNFSKKKARAIISGRVAKQKKIVFEAKEDNPRYKEISKLIKNCLNEKEGALVGDVPIPGWFKGV